VNVDELLREHAPSRTAMRDEASRLRSTVLEAAMSTDGSYVTVLPRVRRRRTLARLATAVAVLAVIGAGVGLSLGGSSPASAAQERFVNSAAAPAYDTYGAFSSGKTVYIGNHQVTFDEKIKAMYYTSEGVLVRMGRVDYTDDNGPSHYTLIRPDGSHTSIDLRMGDRVVATDPDSPNVAYAEPNGKRWSFVVINLVTGKEVARTTVDGAFTWGGWEAPPVTMAGHRMWALFDAGWMEYDWKSGATRMVPGTKGDSLYMAHGRYVEYDEQAPKEWIVKDFVTGEIVRRIPITQNDFGALSPDGRFARFINGMNLMDGEPTRDPVRFVTVDTGKTLDLPKGADYGWTPRGNAFAVDPKNDRLTVCDPGTAKCDRIDLEISGSGKVKLGGLPYES
jgi:hypothetical protein